MSNFKRKTVQVIGEPTRYVRKKLAGRRPIFWACWVIFWVLVLWDFYLSMDAIKGNTWSEVMRGVSVRKPVLPWLLGAFLAHLFHFRDDLKPIFDRDASITVMVALTFGLVAIGMSGVELDGWCMTLLVILGIAAGLLLWPKLRLAVWYW